MDETTGKGLSLVGTIFLTIALLTLGVLLFSVASSGAKAGQEKMANITQGLQQTEFTTYDNGTMSGSQVLNAVRQYMNNDQFGIQVTTGKKGIMTYGNTFNSATGVIESEKKNLNVTPAQTQASEHYINPSGKFKSTVVYDQNGVVRGLVFVQDSVVTTP